MNLSNELQQQKKATDEMFDISKQQTIDYLTKNPEFFKQQTDLLASLEIPHSSGSAVSLIERQVAILREENSRYKKQLHELFDIAKENDQLNQSMHTLTLSLLNSNNFKSCEDTLKETLYSDFSVDTLALKLFIEPLGHHKSLFVEKKSNLAQELDKILTLRKPVCGFFNQLPLDTLFAKQAKSLSSLAVIPLFIERNNCFGALILGSNNMHRFRANMGTVFLERLGEILSHRLNSFIENHKH